MEIMIPENLGQTSQPLSFRFYDPILSIVQENISDDRKEFFYTRNN
jgi:hypothetical protein